MSNEIGNKLVRHKRLIEFIVRLRLVNDPYLA